MHYANLMTLPIQGAAAHLGPDISVQTPRNNGNDGRV
jgi:hypothetical protein